MQRFTLVLSLALVLAGCHDTVTGPPRPGTPGNPGTPATPSTGTPATIALTPDSALLHTGDTLRISAVVRDSSGNVLDSVTVTWASSRPSVASVDSSGLVTGLSAGTADVVAQAGPAQQLAHVGVEAVPVASVDLEPDSVLLQVGSSVQLTLTALDSAGDTVGLAGRDVVWSSSDIGIAAIVGDGVVEAHDMGSAVIRAAVEGVTDSSGVRVVPVTAGLSSEDSARLTRNLEAIAATSAWLQPRVDSANGILADPNYTAADWQAFFSAYFSGDRLTGPLRTYLQNPLFYWFTPDVQQRLQEGIRPVVMSWLRVTMATQGQMLGSAFASDPGLREGMVEMHRLLNQILNLGIVPDRAASVLDFYVEHVRSYPFLYAQPSILQGDLQLASPLRLQAWINLVEAQIAAGAPRSVVESALQLQGEYLTIFEHTGTLVNDNDGFTIRQLDVIRTYMDSLPPSLLHLSSISQMELLGNVNPTIWPVSGAPNPYGGFDRNSINIFSVGVGQSSEDAFPSDVTPREIDVFSSALAHETNHVVDCCYVKDDSTLRRRETALIAAAGSDSLNYLRSMFPAGFFQNAPQEFFASISNQWFDDSEQVFRLGRVRFDAGRPQPLDQALFFAEVYSRGGPTVPLYRIDAMGNLSLRHAPVTRDGYGHIDTIVIGDSTLTFTRQPNGNVIGYQVQGP